MSWLKKIFGTANDRLIKQAQPIIQKINEFEPLLKTLSDSELQNKTNEFKNRLAIGVTLEELLPEVFAVCREASHRVLGMRHFDVQLLGGIFLHRGSIAEMKTGEGKTLVATLPVYLNALNGQGVHVVTVNDYLASRDAQWMGQIYKFLGLSVGVVRHGLTDTQRQEAYGADITHGTNNEFGFDYLRDNMKFAINRMVQRPLNFAIVDEVDSILIDEARTPLIISGPSDPSTDKYTIINGIIPGLILSTHFTLDEKARSVMLTDAGVAEVERRLKLDNLYDPHNIEILHHVNQGLKAHVVFKRDVDYVVKDGEVQIVDEFTGRILPGRRWSDGLHQAIEAKEGVAIESENQTLASITYQNYFRMYKKLAGMTGTADTEATEFQKIYNLRVVVIPPHRANQRVDLNDAIYKTEKAKLKAVVEEVKSEHKKGRPILIGTIAIEKSELLSKMLTREGIAHNVLNAKHHEREAEIIAQAGRYNAITVSTNMAGRGTDILLGGNPLFLAKAKVPEEMDSLRFEQVLNEQKELCANEQKKVVAAGGLYVIGTERHESRRIDNQLRGRTARQGDVGQSRYYISLEDDLMRIFGSDRVKGIMSRLGMGDDEAIEHKWITKAIEGAQKRVEAHHFESRKHVLEYDDVMNQQRSTIYKQRRQILAGENLHDFFTDQVDVVVSACIDRFLNKENKMDVQGFVQTLYDGFGIKFISPTELNDAETVGRLAYEFMLLMFDEKKTKYGEAVMNQAVRYFLLQTLDDLWKDHLLSMDHLRDGIGLRGYGQKDPKQEYKKEGFALFEEMMTRLAHQAVEKIYKVQIKTEADVKIDEETSAMTAGQPQRPLASSPISVGSVVKLGRNDVCPCGSGKKFKKCHGREVA